MKTQLDFAKAGIVTEEMRRATEGEAISPEELSRLMAAGLAVLPKNVNHSFPRIKAIGHKLKTKVNANLGTSDERADLKFESCKLSAATKAQADSIMDLSTGGDLRLFRSFFLEKSPVMVGAVPIYAVAAEVTRRGEPLEKMSEEELFASIEEQCRQGIDYITVHCGITRQSFTKLSTFERIMPCVSRGGSIHLYWMQKTGRENPLYEYFDDLLEIAHRYDVTLSLGDGLRPGTILDAIDAPQIEELMILAELSKRAKESGVQVMIEGPGHVPLPHIQSHVQLEKRLCDGAPFYVLGPIPTDIAPGYDHITSAIGGALAASAGADFLCYVTPAEHLGLPDENDVYLGVMAARVAAHVGDIAKGLPGAVEKDKRISLARERLDWEGMMAEAVDPELVRCKSRLASDQKACTMCGKLCAVKMVRAAYEL
ncbi:MAG: phosphomethylpyrimidine synthase [Candidatus Atribacteria bacterium]|nr:phosphomethylpyrimidine synthase [Candidatus Atribacteria bacterium]